MAKDFPKYDDPAWELFLRCRVGYVYDVLPSEIVETKQLRGAGRAASAMSKVR